MPSARRQIHPLHLVLATLSLIGAAWGMVGVHAAHPHEGSVTREEWLLLRDLIQSEHAAIRREIQRLESAPPDRK